MKEKGHSGKVSISLFKELSEWKNVRVEQDEHLLFFAEMQDGCAYIDRYGDARSKKTAWKIKWAFIILHMEELMAQYEPYTYEESTKLYNEFKEEQRHYGESEDAIILDGNQTGELKQILGLLGETLYNNTECTVISVNLLFNAAASAELIRRRKFKSDSER